MQQPSIDRIAAVFDRNATRYDRQIGAFERFMLGGARGWAVGHARGRVLELAVGTGLNLPRYGSEVERVIGVDVSQGVLDIARQRPHRQDLAVQLRLGDVQDLDVADSSVDTVVSTYTFCTIPDPGRACAQAYRALVPGGVFVLAEHGPSTSAPARLFMRLIEPISVRFGADHLLRDPIPYLEAAGFVISESRRTGRGGVTFRVLAQKPAD
ncbi:methyltransferase domain-containing protein [Nocardia puris]|uniref:class I SAM-dependent methyltransferase n=1 Tax=Nocardia TaxID=1817 RepID=UPI000A35E7B0|nr:MULTISPECIES: class I SAM-dependent methyltransferase [Nocardia]UAK33344.1 methyltransferase domain-containing protein [Nocardia asteroides]MBF6070663.1 methyltransferase domain-containing protein [Nocardia farcinica]MBF6235121.1 methyltransferase domain-containing protein [Nocardia farcinica]MBF6271665.1 methyltransferase domain-containing protein [Nocardia farcinica]MBF6359828.1 methyltransferase domain-containing protein [Nocardia farcinica]